MGYPLDCPGLSTIGYKEIILAIRGAITLQSAKELIQQGNRNYAKRQMTWNKRYEELPIYRDVLEISDIHAQV